MRVPARGLVAALCLGVVVAGCSGGVKVSRWSQAPLGSVEPVPSAMASAVSPSAGGSGSLLPPRPVTPIPAATGVAERSGSHLGQR